MTADERRKLVMKPFPQIRLTHAPKSWAGSSARTSYRQHESWLWDEELRQSLAYWVDRAAQVEVEA